MVRNTKETFKGKNGKVNNSTKASSVKNTSSDDSKSKTMVKHNKGDPRVDGALIGKKSRSQTLSFLLTFEIFSHNFENCLVDSGASSNVIPYWVCKNINVGS